MPSSSFFVQNGYSNTTQSTFDQLVEQAIQNAGAIGPKSVTIRYPTGDDDVILFFVNAEAPIQQITASVRGSSPSITYDLTYGPSQNGPWTSVFSGSQTVTSNLYSTSFANGTIPADSYVRLSTSTKSGDVDELAISIDF